MQPLADQIWAFLLVAFLGMALGLVYDLYRVIRQIWRPKRWGTILGDALFWIFSTALAYGFLLYITWGEVRLYVVLALAGGLAVYLKAASRYVSYALLHIYLIAAQIFTRLFKLILFPFRLIWRIILIPFRFIAFFVVLVLQGARQVRILLQRVQDYWRGQSPPSPPDDCCK